MNTKNIKVTIVIPTYNGGEEFKECLKMVHQQKVNLEFEVIVIDSGSTDSTLNYLKAYPIRLKQIQPNEFDHGLTRNMAIGLAQGEYVVLMSQDAIPTDSYWLENILANFKDDLVAGVYCKQIPKNDADVLTKRQLNGHFTGRQHRMVNYIEDDKSYNILDPMAKLALCTFDDVCACVRKTVWSAIPYTKTYFAEDLEWGKKVIEAGYKIVYEPRAAVSHSHDRSVLYEYKRTYLCHRRLYDLFKLQTIPTFKNALMSTIFNIHKDIAYVFKEEQDWKKKLSLIMKIPCLSIASVFGQYKGARDEKLGRPLKNIRGV